jgi:hypothetical protein
MHLRICNLPEDQLRGMWDVLHDFSTCMPACRDDSWLTTSHEKGICALYGVCGHRKDHSGLDCPDNQPGSALDGQALQKLQDICPQLATEHGPDGKYCCTEEQIDTLSHQVVCHHIHSLAHGSMVKSIIGQLLCISQDCLM